MKLSRIAAAGAGVALIAGSVFVGGVAANAADIPVTLPVIPAETSPYSAGWFAGTVAGGDGTAVQGTGGLVITGGTEGYQLLNGDPVGTSVSFADAFSYQGVSAVGGNAFYQISLFANAGTDFTTLRPVDTTNLWGDWTLSQSVDGLTAGTSYTKDEITTALALGDAPQVLAFGIFVNAGDTVTLRGLIFNEDSYLFAAAPTLTIAPAKVAIGDTTTVVTITGTGFTPGETTYLGASSSNGAGLVDQPVADASGNIVYTFTLWANAEIDDVTYSISDEGGVFSASAVFSVVAKTLAATGVDLTAPIFGTGLVLVAGFGLLMVARRKSAATA
jgi:hypothetical protein